jgi:hypothetical protein
MIDCRAACPAEGIAHPFIVKYKYLTKAFGFGAEGPKQSLVIAVNPSGVDQCPA